jgi:hypothetical protein
MPNLSAINQRAKAATMERLPWARLMMRITLNMKDRPQAIMA